MDKDLKKLIEISQSGGAVLKKYFGKKLDIINEKYDASDLQTTADLESEKVIIDQLKKYYPDYNILSEEAGEIDNGSDYTFIIDPLDGTNNFVLGIANFTSVIALVKDGNAQLAAINSPMTGETFYAQAGQGAFLNGEKIIVNDESSFKRSTVSFHVDYSIDVLKNSKMNEALAQDSKRVFTNWSPAFDLCLLATGKIEGIIRDSGVVHDFVAGKMIAREAGAKITDYQGNPDQKDEVDQFIISNGRIHDKLIKIANSVKN